jgi:hypothetical protein
MLSKRSVRKLLIIGVIVAPLQPMGAFAADPASVLETPIAAVSDDGQLNDVLDTHNDLNESHNQVDQGIQEAASEASNDAHEAMNDANDAKNDAQQAQQDANEATQEDSLHNSDNGVPPAAGG